MKKQDPFNHFKILKRREQSINLATIDASSKCIGKGFWAKCAYLPERISRLRIALLSERPIRKISKCRLLIIQKVILAQPTA
jgi:hypothetical protein